MKTTDLIRIPIILGGLAAILSMVACGSQLTPPVTSSTASAATTQSANAPSVEPRKALPVVQVGQAGTLAESAQNVAIARGYFEQEGISATQVKFPSGNPKVIFAALLSGQVDAIGASLGADVFNAAPTAKGIKIVGSQGTQEPGGPAWLVIRKQLFDSGAVKSYADLKGLRIAVTGKGVNTDYLAAKALEAGGLAPSDAYLPVMDYSSMVAGLANGSIDAAFANGPAATAAVQRGVGAKWRAWGDVVPGIQTAVLVFSPKLAANHDLAVRWMTAYIRGARDYYDAFFKDISRQQAVDDIMSVSINKDPSVFEGPQNKIDPNGKFNLASIEDQVRWHKQMGYITEQVDLPALLDTTLSDAAISKLGAYQ